MTVSFYKGLTRTLEMKILLFEFCPISWDWDKLGIPNLPRTSLVKCYWTLQNTRVIVFTVSELLREIQQGGKITPAPLFTQIRVKFDIVEKKFFFDLQIPLLNRHESSQKI